MNKPVTLTPPDLEFDSAASKRLRKVRKFKDQFTTGTVAVGGISVIVAILLIFIYLLYEVAPLFEAAEVHPYEHNGQPTAPYSRPGSDAATLYMTAEEQGEVGLRLSQDGQATFFDTRTGQLIQQQQAGLSSASLAAYALESEANDTFALAHADNSLSFVKHSYKTTYPLEGGRVITPSLVYPLGEEPLELSPELEEIEHLAVRNGENRFSVVAADAEGRLRLTRFDKEVNFITEEVELSSEHYNLPDIGADVTGLLISPDQRWLFIADFQGRVHTIDLRDPDSPLVGAVKKATSGQITSFSFLLGGSSLLIADDKGIVSQWFLVRDANNDYELQRIREFSHVGTDGIVQVNIEQRRKGFITAEANGQISFYNATAENQVLSEQLSERGIAYVALTPRANRLLLEDGEGNISFWQVNNEHPEVSWSSLWQEVWYEGHEEPKFLWQSSASNDDFEPKYSLAPLAFGTLKAAFYAMLLATPLAICGAIYTAYFMAPALRRKIKPMIELMEALPTVILGFLAGLWLAPFIEANLTSIFALLVMVPVGVLLFAYLWQNLPKSVRYLVPDGWDAALLIPVVILLSMLAIGLADGIEVLAFGGDMKVFITDELGIDFDQRNALVVGLAMGFAVIPTIFSITEDAIFSVPKHLSNGSLALGATPWQTLSRVVMPTASPGIFSAVMIGMGRAVGETMIVLMATGNTPIMDMNIFEGMRTLAANIAVEMPEAEVASSHYRILFLAALVLFAFTFVVNTLAEIVRQRLRRKYGSL
ncbi:ABC transporter permease subunit [Motiliproteus sediminis]|uniref:ABC transporter permease subunit n=1 Tax=Motiliproteus sediminis TaxID=1468178 RepID=UPI001AF023B4|nr:ABC transporter permease subunit [Motiliproteus sediminis]